MKNCKKRNASFDSRIFAIALVTMLAATTLWAKPKDAVEYTPFKSENPNASVYECEYIKGYDEGLLLIQNMEYWDTEYWREAKCTAFSVYGWQKKKGGWKKLGKYEPNKNDYIKARVLDDDSDKYTHYAVEFEAAENSLTFSTKGQRINNNVGFEDSCMIISFSISEDYKKLVKEKRAAEKAEQERLAAEEKAKQNAARDAKGKEIAKGYIYHGRDEASRNAKLFAGGALEEGHAYYISNYIAGNHGTGAAYMGSYPDYHMVEYASPKVKAEAVTRTSYEYNSWLKDYTGSTVPVVVAGKKGCPIVLGIVDID